MSIRDRLSDLRGRVSRNRSDLAAARMDRLGGRPREPRSERRYMQRSMREPGPGERPRMRGRAQRTR